MAARDPQVVCNQEFIDILDYEFTGDNATVLRKRALIEAYREEGSVYHAALVVRVNRKTVYRWIENDPQFALAMDESKEDCYDKAETSVFKKALAGDSLLLMFYLKAHRHKFRDKISIDVEGVRNEIEQRMAQLSGAAQLPPMSITDFVDSAQELQAESLNTLRFPPQLDDQQKDPLAPARSHLPTPDSE